MVSGGIGETWLLVGEYRFRGEFLSIIGRREGSAAKEEGEDAERRGNGEAKEGGVGVIIKARQAAETATGGKGKVGVWREF